MRIPSPDPYRASQAIYDGAVSVIAPYLETENQIRDLVGATKLRPLKGEKLRTIQDGSDLLSEDLGCNLEDYDHPDFIAAVKSIVNSARKHTLGVGIHFSLDPGRGEYLYSLI